MANCAYCSTTIIFGGKQFGSYRFCNDRCVAKGQLLVTAEQLPPGAVMDFVHKLHQSRCPKCGGPGPIDVFTSHTVWSVVIMTQWKNQPMVSCAPCGRKSQIQAALLSLVAGWWGFPWGFIMTPVQIVRNCVAIARGRDPLQPSPDLERLARIEMAAQLLAPPPSQA